MKRVVIALIAAVSVGCPGFGDKTLEELSPTPNTAVTWDSDISAILTTKCGGCHTLPAAGGAPADFRLDTYDRSSAGGMLDGAFEKTERIKARSLDSMTMPPAGSAALTDEERGLLSTWIENGAPLSDSGPTWNSEIGAILTAQCGSCHSESPAAGIPTSFRLDAYNRAEAGGTVDGAFEKIDRIKARAIDSKTMPPGGPLSTADQAKIQSWIDAGAPLE